MVVIFTANKKGGILQFAFQMKKTFEMLYDESVLFVPHDCKLEGKGIIHYARHNSILPHDKEYMELAEQIQGYNPSFLFACESQLISSRIVKILSSKVACYICVHDFKIHPSYEELALVIKQILKQFFIKRAWERSKGIVLLSNNVLRQFIDKYPQYKEKCGVIPLGAHVPDASAKMPQEIKDLKNYILFFGRIDKYKGLSILLEAYSAIDSEKLDLVIAGGGTLLDSEKEIIYKNKQQIYLINRFIEDGEMLALFKNSKCVVLPYIEASQSGVLAMAYYFGKPVIVSDLPGLREFVVHGKTGYIFKNIGELKQYISEAAKFNLEENIRKYYNENMEWDNTVKEWIKKFPGEK